jgi:hypothetical protein
MGGAARMRRRCHDCEGTGARRSGGKPGRADHSAGGGTHE